MPEQNPVRSLSRGLALLRSISSRGSATLAELHADTGISRPAILRLLHTLEAEGYARRWLSDGRYRISSTAPDIIKASHWSAVVADVVGPALRELLKHLSWPADVAVSDGTSMVLCETTRRHSPHMINPVAAGYRVHMLQSAVGRAYLSYCAPEIRSEILDQLKASTDQFDQLARDEKSVDGIISEVRDRGYALRAKGYHAARHALPLEFAAAALPLLIEGQAVACISVTWVATAISPAAFIAENLALLQAAARQAEDAIRTSELSGHVYDRGERRNLTVDRSVAEP